MSWWLIIVLFPTDELPTDVQPTVSFGEFGGNVF